MKRRTIIILTTLLLAAGITMPTRAESIDSVFAAVPRAELPLLKLNARLDMLDLYNSGMSATGENMLGGTSEMVYKGKNLVRVKLTAASNWEMMRVQRGTEWAYVCIHTLSAPLTESRLSLYSENWQSIDGEIMPALTLNDFWQETDSLSDSKREELWRRLQPMRVEMSWNEEAEDTPPTLTLKLATGALGREDRELAEKYMRQLTLTWNGQALVRR